MSSHTEKGRHLMTNIDFIVNLQVLVGTAFIQNILPHRRTRAIRDVIVEREGEGEVRLSIGFDVDVLPYAASDRVVVDRINKL